MSKFIKVLSVIMSAVMLMAFPVSAFAEEKTAEPHTLEQLFAMSDEEFLKLEGAESLYNAKLSSEPFNNISGMVYYWIGDSVDDGSYKRGKTEKELSALLHGTIPPTAVRRNRGSTYAITTTAHLT